MKVKSKAKQLNVKLDNLVLDVKNPRFAELYDGSGEESDLIEYLISNEAGEDIAKAIVKAGEFYPDKPLWVIKEGKKYLVKDGNRRCSAVKALQLPGKYKLNLPKTTIEELPVLLYDNIEDINERIVEEHAGSLFRRWERIAKALEVFKLSEQGKTEELLELDSKPGDLIKLASFYTEAVLIGENDLRQLLRRGRGKSGGKTIIFERLFRDCKACGYTFKNSPSFKIDIKNREKFNAYVLAIIKYLKTYPATTTDTIDRDRDFIKRLKPYGFDAYPIENTTHNSIPSSTSNEDLEGGVETMTAQDSNPSALQGVSFDGATSSYASIQSGINPSAIQTSNSNNGSNNTPFVNNQSSAGSRKSIKKTPTIKRKKLQAGLNKRISEFFQLDATAFPNAKTAMARVTFECVLKYVVEKTKFNGKTTMDKTSNFQGVYSNKKFSDFTLMKTKFTELIKEKGIHGAFIAFDLDTMHTIVHNYNVNATPVNAETISNNLVILIDFMLQDEQDLLNSLDLTKFA